MVLAVVVVIAVGAVHVSVVMAVVVIMGVVVAAIWAMHVGCGRDRCGRSCLVVGHGFPLLPSIDVMPSA